MHKIRIVAYQPRHQAFFESFNRAWIEAWFEVEPVDEWVLQNPEKAIIEPGGAILMAEWNGRPAGTVGLRKLSGRCFEFTKMAVDESYRRRGIARLLCLASFQKAMELGAEEIILYSNTKNAHAIKLYEQMGFEHMPVEKSVYERANVKMRIEITKAAMLLQQVESNLYQSI